jgi:hypothetical protein
MLFLRIVDHTTLFSWKVLFVAIMLPWSRCCARRRLQVTGFRPAGVTGFRPPCPLLLLALPIALELCSHFNFSFISYALANTDCVASLMAFWGFDVLCVTLIASSV